MEDFLSEGFEAEELTVQVTVPLYWSDDTVLEDSDNWVETTQFRGVFTAPYLDVDLGIPGQQGSVPHITIRTVDIPHATEGDKITVNGKTYRVGVPMPDGSGVTQIDLYLNPEDEK